MTEVQKKVRALQQLQNGELNVAPNDTPAGFSWVLDGILAGMRYAHNPP
jgi:hypothetical protein